MIEKACRAAAFLSWYYQTSLPEGQVCFYLTCLYNTILFVIKHVFVFFLIKKKGKWMQSFVVPLYSFQISYVCLIDASAFDSFILLPLYN
jgi:hypothetical protein